MRSSTRDEIRSSSVGQTNVSIVILIDPLCILDKTHSPWSSKCRKCKNTRTAVAHSSQTSESLFPPFQASIWIHVDTISLSLSLLSFLSSCILIYSHPPVPAAPHISHRASQHPHPDPRPHVASSHAQPHRLQRRPPKSSSSPLPGTRWHRSA